MYLFRGSVRWRKQSQRGGPGAEILLDSTRKKRGFAFLGLETEAGKLWRPAASAYHKMQYEW